MIFNLFKKKKKESFKTYEGRIITDDEIKDMVRPKGESYAKGEYREMCRLIEELKEYKNNIDDGK